MALAYGVKPFQEKKRCRSPTIFEQTVILLTTRSLFAAGIDETSK